jgi:1,4-alpha-glucan branching enzyme
MRNKITKLFVVLLAVSLFACKPTIKTKDGVNCCPRPEVKLKSTANFPDWSCDATIYEVNIRQYTPEGTFAAFEKQLPRLKELGVEILWIMPISPISEKNRKGSLGSYYAISDYKKVNPEFGTLDDFKSLVSKCHELGFKVIVDWVANHTGWDNVWITKHPDWYTTDSTGKIIPPVADWSDVADLNYNNKDMRAAMIDAMQYWVKEADIDGYRCDVAGMVPVDFWNEARASLDEIKPVYMLAEDEGEKALLLKAFNMNYGWEFLNIMNQVAVGKAGVPEVKSYFTKTDTIYPDGSYAMQFTSNHDENSWKGTEYERLGDAVKTMAALTFVVPGMPLIYTGQEAGNNMRLKFFDKDQVDWSNLEMQQFYSKLIGIKKENKALWNGSAGAPAHFLHTTVENSMLVIDRAVTGNHVISIFNLSSVPVTNNVGCPRIEGKFKNAITGEKVSYKTGQQFMLKGWEYLILIGE